MGSLGQLSPTLDSVGDFTQIGPWIESVLGRIGAWEPYGASSSGIDLVKHGELLN